MTNLYIYSIIYLILVISSCIAFILLYKKYKGQQANFIQKIVLYSLGSTLIISSFATIYCISLLFNKDNKISTLSRPNIGEGNSTISINVDSDIYSGPIDIEIQEKQISFEEAIDIFSKYREELDTYVLGNNISFCEITTPLNFPSTIGKENIAISWYISNPNIIDYTGNILTENIEADSSDLEIIATLKLEEHIAEICYYITVKKIPPTAEEQLSTYINNHINDSSLLNKININLPSTMNGINLTFYSKEKSFPPIYFYSWNCYHSRAYHNY